MGCCCQRGDCIRDHMVGKVRKKQGGRKGGEGAKKEGGRKEGREGGECRKKALAARPREPGFEPGTYCVLGDDPQLQATGVV